MSVFKKVLVSAAMFAAMSTAFSGSVLAKELRVASNPTFPPFEFVNSQNNEVTGFEMDLIRAMGKHLGYDIKIVNMGFDGIIPAILTGTVDVAATGMSVTPERQKKVLFTETFYKSGLTILVSKDHANEVKSFEDLKGKKVAVQIGTTAAAKAKQLGAECVTFNNASEAILDLKTGNTVAVINDKPVTDYILTQQPELKNITVHLDKNMLTADDFAMAVSKKNPELLNELNSALKALKENGEFAKLQIKWFGKAE